MKILLSTSALALMLAAAPAAAQMTPPPAAPGQPQPPMANQAMPGSSSQTDIATMPGGQMGSTTTPATGTPGSTMQAAPYQGAPNQSAPYQGTTQPGMSTPNSSGQSQTMAPVPSDQMGSSAPQSANGSRFDNSSPQAGATTGGTADQMGNPRTTSAADSGPTSPDGTPAFGIEPYFGVLGGYHDYDNFTDGFSQPGFDGAAIEGVLGVNVPLGPVFVGVEGHLAYGFGDARWEYGVRGRGGFRIGDSGLIYGSAGYMWTDVRNGRGFFDRETWMYGLGVEAGPRDIGLGGITSNSGLRFRISVETADFESIRPMAGVIVHF